MTVVPRRLVGLAAGGAVATLVDRFGRRRPPGGPDRWARRNHRGQSVTLWGGPSVAAGSLVGVAISPGLPARVRCAALVAGAAGAVLGGYDDLAGTPLPKDCAGTWARSPTVSSPPVGRSWSASARPDSLPEPLRARALTALARAWSPDCSSPARPTW